MLLLFDRFNVNGSFKETWRRPVTTAAANHNRTIVEEKWKTRLSIREDFLEEPGDRREGDGFLNVHTRRCGNLLVDEASMKC